MACTYSICEGSKMEGAGMVCFLGSTWTWKLWPESKYQHWVIREGRRELALVESLTANLYSFNFNTLSPRETEDFFRTLLQKEGHSVSVPCNLYMKMLLCPKCVLLWSSTPAIFNWCVGRIFKTCNTWLFSQRHWPLFPYMVKLKNDNSQHNNNCLVWMNLNYTFYFCHIGVLQNFSN